MKNMERIKVRLHTHENDDYNELWKEVGGKRYFARHTYMGSVWYYVSDPLGYCELSHPCEPDITFIVCDQDGNELFEDSNATDFVFPTLEGAAKQKWEEVKDKYPLTTHLQDWLLSYMTPENLAKDPVNTQFCPEDNWKRCWHDRVDHTAVEKFTYLGELYCIWAITYQHRYCDCRWVEYLAGPEGMDWEYPWFIHHFGDSFTPDYGPMYSRNEAIQMISDALKEIYGGTNLSEIQSGCCGAYERKLSYSQAAERMIDGDLSREHVKQVIEQEREHHGFYTSKSDMERDFPGYRPDYNYRFW